MAITEAERYALVGGLIEMLGEERAETLMKCVLPEGWEHLATKQDVELAGERLRGEFSELRGGIRGDFGELRGEFGELRGEFGELRGEFGELRGELRGELAGLRGHIDSALARQARTYLFALMGFALTIWVTLLVPAVL